ncbi:MAG: hypothetical protein KDD69_14740 [Bdellovibrionales bacterium]|nr:hypothetical protein [Bdellovibrionales bacterium]
MKKILSTALLVHLMLTSGSHAEAQDTVLRSPAYSFATPFDISSDDEIAVQLHADKSYECVILTTFQSTSNDDYFVFSTTAFDPDDQSITVTATGTEYPGAMPRANGVQSVERARARINLIAQKTGRYRFAIEEVAESNPGGAAPATVQCRETTLLGSYNRFFAGVAIVEMQSLALLDQSVFVTIVDSNGAVQVDKQEFVVKANTRTDLIFSSLPAANFGQITITTTAPFGTLSGTVAEYDFESGGAITLKRERPLRVPSVVP